MNHNQSHITLVAISDIKIKETLDSLMISNSKLHPAKTIFFTSKTVYLDNNQSKSIIKIKVKPIKSIRDYSEFIIYSLYKYIATSHVLIVQWDGYIINPKKWNSNFLKYDYIGAPFIPRENETNYSKDLQGRFFCVGNGGFSLRSKSLLEAPSKYNLIDDENLTNNHEDGFFSILHRSFLESKGFKWAPFLIANEFSLETPISFKDFIDLPFGFHGKRIFYFLKIKNFIKKLFFIF